MKKFGNVGVVIGGSAGSLEAMLQLITYLDESFIPPLIVVNHIHPLDDGGLVDIFNRETPLIVKEAEEKDVILNGHIYFPPANYHLLVERNKTFSLSIDNRVNFARPSIDVLFESAAFTYTEDLVGIILSGANRDGAEGIRAIKKYGGLTIAQDPGEAVHSVMPQAAIETGCIDKILTVREIGKFLHTFSGSTGNCKM